MLSSRQPPLKAQKGAQTEDGSVHILTDEVKKVKVSDQKGRREVMIIDVKISRCPNCDSVDIIRNGTDYKGDQKYHCHCCGGYGTLHAKARYSQAEKARVLKAYQERVSMRGIRRIFTLRQRLVHFVRKTLSFSKSEVVHDLVLRFFIINYNLQCSISQ